jgi:hypothetical protein
MNENIWVVVQPTGEFHFLTKPPLEGFAEWAKGQDITVLEYKFVRHVYKKKPPPPKPK